MIKADLHYVCKIFGVFSFICDDLINNKVHKALKFAEKPSVICTIVLMCFGDELIDPREIEMGAIENSNMLTTNEISNEVNYEWLPKFGMCKLAIKGIKHLIHHADKNEIKKVLFEFCQKTWKMRHICEDMVKNHADEIVYVLGNHLPAKAICKKIGMCHKNKVSINTLS